MQKLLRQQQRKPPQAERIAAKGGGKSTRSVPSRQGQTFHEYGKFKKAAKPTKEAAKRQKDLIGLVRSRHCGELNRGLENLGAPERETDLFFSLVRKEPKVPQRFANLWTPGTIQISARYKISAEVTGVHQVTGCAGNFNLSGYRR